MSGRDKDMFVKRLKTYDSTIMKSGATTNYKLYIDWQSKEDTDRWSFRIFWNMIKNDIIFLFGR